jgi:hypothetical protein
MGLRAAIAVLALVALLGLGIATATYALVHSPIDAPDSPVVHHDDFAFILDGPIVTHGPEPFDTKIVEIPLRIENHAKIVSYHWVPTTAYLVDADGRRYESDQLKSTPATTIPAGQSARVKVVYSIPYYSPGLRLAFWDGVMMGDVFDGLRYARLRLRLFD